MHDRVLKPSWKHNAALNAVHLDDDTQKLLAHAQEKDPKKSHSIEDAIVSIVSPDTTDVEALNQIHVIGNKLIPYLINIVFHPKTPAMGASNAKASLDRILRLPIIIEKVDQCDTLLRYLMNQAYHAENIEAQIYVMDFFLTLCKVDENKIIVVRRLPGLIKLIIFLTRTSNQEELKECAVSIMWVLASKDENRIFMIEPSFIDFIIDVCSDEGDSRIQLLTLDTLRLLSESTMHEGFLISYRGGALLALLQNLSKDSLRCSIAIAALYTISNLVTPMSYSHLALFDPCLLTSVAMQAADCCLYGIVHAAAGVIDKFAEFLDATHPEHAQLLCALSIMLDSKTDCGVIMALYSITTQTQRVINCSSLALCKPLMNTLTVSR